MNLKVREVFYTLQGEGSRAGEASIFIRLSGCNQACWFCDTDWSFGRTTTVADLAERIKKYPCNWIVWTGGEPTLQLTDRIVEYFRKLGYQQAIETNGSNPVPEGINFVSCSPKVSPEILRKSFEKRGVINEYRYVVNAIDIDKQIPDIEDIPKARHYYLSPLFLGEEKKRFEIQPETVRMCVEYIKEHHQWKLSIQQHKIWQIP